MGSDDNCKTCKNELPKSPKDYVNHLKEHTVIQNILNGMYHFAEDTKWLKQFEMTWTDHERLLAQMPDGKNRLPFDNCEETPFQQRALRQRDLAVLQRRIDAYMPLASKRFFMKDDKNEKHFLLSQYGLIKNEKLTTNLKQLVVNNIGAESFYRLVG